jgi:uncharacterized membrane protein SirB2
MSFDADEMSLLMGRLKGEFLKSDGSRLDYKEIRASPNFTDFQLASTQLNLLTLTGLSPEEGKAFFLSKLLLVIYFKITP